MWNTHLYDIFSQLLSKPKTADIYEVEAIDESLPHKIGCSKDGCPVLFVECADEEKIQDIKLTLFSVMYNRNCEIHDVETGQNHIKKYSVFHFKSTEPEFQKYFLDVVYMILLRLPIKPENQALDTEIRKIITLFTNAKKPSAESIRGLFAELMVIDLSRNPHYLLKSWHVAPNDPFDFNDGKDKVEVKSSTKEGRMHKFAMHQLIAPAGANLVIASITILQTGLGMNIYELMDRITLKVQDDIDLLIHLRETVTSTVGKYFSEVAEYRFDYGIAEDSYALFDAYDVPCIPLKSIPPEISNVHFTVDMSGLDSANSQNYESELINSLF